MKRILLAVFFVFSLVGVDYAAESEEKGTGRYTLFLIEIDKKPTPILLDTKTGKVWLYTEEQSVGANFEGKKARFKGLTVDGLVYSSRDLKEFEQQIEQLHLEGFVNKELKGFKEHMSGEFSYSPDLGKIQAVNERVKNSQPKKE